MTAKADLHMHTVHSDGILTVAQLLDECARRGLTTISITDHDSVEAFPEAIERGAALGIEVIVGVELSAAFEDRDVHILGYFMDHQNERLRDYLVFFRRERVRRAERIVKKLNNLNVPLTMDEVMKCAGDGAVGRPHIATALLNAGLTRSYQEAFERYIGNHCPAFEKKFQLTPPDAVALISSSGGLSFLAHPGKYITDDMLQHLIKAGLDGIEVIHPAHTNELIAHYRGVVNEYCMLESGGSDFHGGNKNDDATLGTMSVDPEVVSVMKRRLFAQKN
ncbi:MAG: PHP domain-containing protein [Acidobacteriota bacterium]